MRRKNLILPVFLAAMVLMGTGSSAFAFTSLNVQHISAAVAFAAPPVLNQDLTIIVPKFPGTSGQVFFGKNLVIPVQLSSKVAIDTSTVQLQFVYQLFDADGKSVGSPTTKIIPFQPDVNNPLTYDGTAIVDRNEITAISNGGSLQYAFSATQLGQTTILGSQGTQRVSAASGAAASLANPFQFSVITSLQSSVSPSGSLFDIPDTDVPDGSSAISFPAQALAGPGTLSVQQASGASLPGGPLGLAPTVVYTFDLEGTSLQRTATLTLSYPSDTNGNVLGTSYSGSLLAPYWLNGTFWQLLALPQQNTTEHTISATITGAQLTTQPSTFALFPVGALGPSDLRPAQRIITPNGDGINDTVTFLGLGSGDTVHIFDVRGRRIRTLSGSSATWDGRDDDGSIVESGVYIYQYTTQGSRVSGVIAVAK